MGIVLGLCLGAGFWTGATRYCCNRNPYRPIVGSPHRKSTKQKEKCLAIYFILKSVTCKRSHVKSPPCVGFLRGSDTEFGLATTRVLLAHGRGSVERKRKRKLAFDTFERKSERASDIRP